MVECGVVFAGGKSSRMGRDKSLLPFGSYPSLAKLQYEKLQQIFPLVYISTKTDKFDFSAKLILDIYKESSPLVGLISIFETIDCDEVFILSVDAPFVDFEVIEALRKVANKNKKSDAIIAKSPLGVKPLCGIYRHSIAPLEGNYLQRNNHKLMALLGESQTLFVDFENKQLFANLNTTHDYEQFKLL